MTFILKDNIVCAGKYVVNQEADGRTMTLNLLSSSDNMQTPVCDARGNDVAFDVQAYPLIIRAVRNHWNYVDLTEFQL